MAKFVATVVLTGWLVFFLVEFAGPDVEVAAMAADRADAGASLAGLQTNADGAPVYVLDARSIRHVEGALYEYDLPGDLQIDLFRPLAFQNLLPFTDDGRRLEVYYAPREMKTQPGYYTIHWPENGRRRLAFSPLEGGDVHAPGRFVLSLDHEDDKVVLANVLVGNDPLAQSLAETFFASDTYSGLVFTADEDMRFSFGANGTNLYSWAAILETARRFRPGLRSAGLSPEEEFDEVLSLFFRSGMLTSRVGMNGVPTPLHFFPVGEGHCGSFGDVMSAVGGLLGGRGFRFGAAGDDWGHTLVYQEFDGRGFIVDGYGILTWPIVPGSPQSSADIDLVAHASRRWAELDKSIDQAYLEDVARFCTDRSYLIYYGPRNVAREDTVAVSLRKGDLIVFDGRVPEVGGPRARWETVPDEPLCGTALWLRSFASGSVDPAAREFSSDFTIREIWVAATEREKDRRVTLRAAGEQQFSSIAEANRWMATHRAVFVRKVLLEGPLPPEVGVVMLASGRTFPLRANERPVSRLGDGGHADYDERRRGSEYVTVARWAGAQPAVRPFAAAELDAIWVATEPSAARDRIVTQLQRED